MMKSIFNFLAAGFLIILVLGSCSNDTALPFKTFDELGYGAYPRLIDGIHNNYDLAFENDDVAGSAIEFTVEFFDEDNGNNVESYSWSVAHSDGSEAALGTILASSFETAPSGLPSATIKFTFDQVLTALNKSISDVTEGERFIFFAELKKKDGSVFTTANTSGNIQSTAGTLRGIFQIVVPII